MDCQWIPFENKYKCSNCGFIVSNNKIHKNCKTQKDIPSIVQRAKNLTKAVVNHVKTGLEHCTLEQKKERFAICKSNKCGLFRSSGDGGICAHDDCGCFIRSNGKFMDKLSWADSKCPVGMWGPVEKIPENDKNDV